MPTTLRPGATTDTIARGDTFTWTAELFTSDGVTETPEDLTGRTYRAWFRSVATDTVLAQTGNGTATVTVTTGDDAVDNRITVTVSYTTTAAWTDTLVKWDLEETDGAARQTILIGTLTLTEDQSR